MPEFAQVLEVLTVTDLAKLGAVAVAFASLLVTMVATSADRGN